MNLEDVRKIYDRWAPFYNPTHSWSLPKRRLAREKLQVKPGDRILDLACGTGSNLPDLRDLVGESGQVIGVDLSPQMLQIARRLIARNGWKNVDVQEADAAKLPFPDNFFNGVICSYALNIIPDYIRAIEEIKQVIVPGGRFVSLEVRSGHTMPQWMMPICGVDLSHETRDNITKIFKNTKVEQFWQNLLFIAVATKDGG